MKCAACGYDSGAAKYVPEDEKPFIELTPCVNAYIYGADGRMVESRYVHLHACPICGTIKMEV
jgi:hypothetical protein